LAVPEDSLFDSMKNPGRRSRNAEGGCFSGSSALFIQAEFCFASAGNAASLAVRRIFRYTI
jgi:hypothetical protein